MYLTYDTSYMSDGFGAQYSRIVGIHCLAQCHGATYVHSVIKEYEHLPADYWKRIDDHFGLSTPKNPNPTLPLLPLHLCTFKRPILEDKKICNNVKSIVGISPTIV